MNHVETNCKRKFKKKHVSKATSTADRKKARVATRNQIKLEVNEEDRTVLKTLRKRIMEEHKTAHNSYILETSWSIWVLTL